jgi:hypothetical protein
MKRSTAQHGKETWQALGVHVSPHQSSIGGMSTQSRSSTLSHLYRRRPETRCMEQSSRDFMSTKPVCVSGAEPRTITA